MADTLYKNSNSAELDSKNKNSNLYCAVCGSRLPSGSIFCDECDPPLPPCIEPEEIGLSLQQALLRIGVLIVLFLPL